MNVDVTLLLAATATAWLAIVIQAYVLRRKTSSTIPTVPSWIPYLGSALDFSKDPVGFIRSCSAKYGSVFNVYLGGKTMTFFVYQKHYAMMLKHKSISHKQFSHDQMYAPKLSKPVEAYHTLRVPHLLSLTAVKSLMEHTFCHQRRVLKSFEPTGRLSLLRFAQRCIFDSGTRALFGNKLVDNSPSLWDYYTGFDKSVKLMVAGVPNIFLRPTIRARDNLIHAIDKNLGDDASTFIKKRNELIQDIPGIEPLDAAKESMSMLWAASTNSITTAYWTLFYLLREKAAWIAVRDEVYTHLPRDTQEAWTSEQLGRCVLLASAVDEALRLCASSLLLRVATDDIDFMEMDPPVHLPKGSNVVIYPALTHFDDEIFPSPNTFKFDRFVNATSTQLEALKLFGMGVTMCPGRNFAKSQVKMFVALVMHEMKRFELVPGYGEPRFDPNRLGMGVLTPADASVEVEFELRL
ncbi:hypothetical protein LEN26_013737 [Aphanomyces euteiches]|nr:hypothetical protein AeMF1_015079 [Aphanomyces euteiches]KAH9110502.1 hypothetical protein LEN26_013737 [Aphanomyces euteiches]KAH9182954.1 hypothetical protein AeNC1_015070 [Aphanomyces euteiches]